MCLQIVSDSLKDVVTGLLCIVCSWRSSENMKLKVAGAADYTMAQEIERSREV